MPLVITTIDVWHHDSCFIPKIGHGKTSFLDKIYSKKSSPPNPSPSPSGVAGTVLKDYRYSQQLTDEL